MMRKLLRHGHEIMELLEDLNEERMEVPEAILLRMCRV
jgi:hypothetical protein